MAIIGGVYLDDEMNGYISISESNDYLKIDKKSLSMSPGA